MSWLLNSFIFLCILSSFCVILQFILLSSSITSLFSPSISVSPSTNKNTTPRLAYLISGSDGDGQTLQRILQAIYHPYNVYVVHLDMAASSDDRRDLFGYIKRHPVFLRAGNVKMSDKPNVISENGPTQIANVLHHAAILLKEGGKWDWFINLDVSSYPLVTQDDLLHMLSQMPRHLNFIDHTHQLSLNQKGDRSAIMITDKALHMSSEGVTRLYEKRDAPIDFNIFTGSAWMGLTRSFIEYCIWGWDNFPRTLLMYHANSISSPESYFQTVICNSKEFQNTIVDTDLHFTLQDDTHQDRTLSITMDERVPVWKSNAPFAREFHEMFSYEVLEWIDKNLLFRGPNMLVPGGWCAEETKMRQGRNGTSSINGCLRIGDLGNLRPGPGARRLKKFFDRLVYNGSVLSQQCAVAI